MFSTFHKCNIHFTVQTTLSFIIPNVHPSHISKRYRTQNKKCIQIFVNFFKYCTEIVHRHIDITDQVCQTQRLVRERALSLSSAPAGGCWLCTTCPAGGAASWPCPCCWRATPPTAWRTWCRRCASPTTGSSSRGSWPKSVPSVCPSFLTARYGGTHERYKCVEPLTPDPWRLI